MSALRDAGIVAVMTTGGAGITRELAHDMARAGMSRVSVSIDGLRAAARRHAGQARLVRAGHGGAGPPARGGARRLAPTPTSTARNQQDLEGLYQHLKAHGVRSWQVQLTAPLGRAADHPEMLLQPYDLLDLLPRIDRLKQRGWREGLLIMPGNNLGFFGPEELRLRSQRPGDGDSFGGCQAGRFVMGIESDGAVKGCPSLPTAAYVGGNAWRGRHACARSGRRRPSCTSPAATSQLWGHCASCAFAEVCRGGCNFTAHAFFGRPGNNPYCHYRALQLQRQGLRERIVPAAPAPGTPFDHGRFALVEEPFDAPEPEMPGYDLVQLRRERRAR